MTLIAGKQTAAEPVTETPRWRRAMVGSSVVLAMLAAGSTLVPPIVIQTSARDSILNAVVDQAGWTVTSTDASGGWLAPLIFRNVRITDPESRFDCTARELRTSRGLLGFLMNRSDIGELRVVEPRVEVHVAEDGKWPEWHQSSSHTTLRYTIENGALRITVPGRPTPIVDIEKLNVSGKIGPDGDSGRMLVVDAAHLLDHEPLSDLHTEQNLALVAPILTQATQVTGEASVWLDEIRIALDTPRPSPFPIKGHATLHALNARLREDWTRQVASLAGSVIGTKLPDKVAVLQDSHVHFEVSASGIVHDGMAFLLPDVARELTITSSGLISLDESLDLELAITLPDLPESSRPLLTLISQLTSEPLRLAVKGTVSEPRLQLPEDLNLLDEVSKRVAPASYESEPPSVPSAVLNIIQGVSNPDREQVRNDLPGSILNLIRAIDQSGRSKPRKPRRGK